MSEPPRQPSGAAALPTQPPADAVLPPRSEHAPAVGAEIPSHYRWCFGCGADHPTGMHLRLRAGEGLGVVGEFLVTEHHQGAPGLAHGGVLAAAFDEVLGAVNWLLAHPAVTARLETDFRRPVPVGTVLWISAEITGTRGRKVWTRAVGRLGGPEGPVAVTAAALFLQVALEHFRDNGSAEYVAAAVKDRADGATSWSFEVNP